MRYLLGLIAVIFLITGLVTSWWISYAVFDDPFVYGRHYLWNATDVGSLSFSDAVFFFEPEPVQHYAHPGLSMAFLSGLLIRVVYAGAMLIGFDDSYVVFAVAHSRPLFFLCSFLSTLLFLGCTVPIVRIVRRFAPIEVAWGAAALHLSAIPVLLYVNRFSDEPYMLFFGLWSIELSFVALDDYRRRFVWFVVGVALALSVFAKPLMAPVGVLNVVFLLVSSRRARESWTGSFGRLVIFVGGFVAIAVPFLAKVPIDGLLGRLAFEANNRGYEPELIKFLSTGHQAPFVAQNALLLALASVGAFLAIRKADENTRPWLVILSLTLLLMVGLIARRPDWHYFFGFCWGALFLGYRGVELAVRATRWRPLVEKSALVAFVVMIAVLNSWRYWGVAVSYYHYLIRYEQRRELVRENPYELPLIWEKSPGNSDLSEIFVEGSVDSPRLEATLQRLRKESGAQDGR